MKKNKSSVLIFMVCGLSLGLNLLTLTSVRADEPSAPTVVAPAQPANAQVVTSQPMTTQSNAAPEAKPPGLMGMALPFVVMLAVMYFLMIRPQQKKLKEHQGLISTLKSGDEVITSAGIIGKVTELTEKVVTLEVSKNVQMRVLKSQVNQIINGNI